MKPGAVGGETHLAYLSLGARHSPLLTLKQGLGAEAKAKLKHLPLV